MVIIMITLIIAVVTVIIVIVVLIILTQFAIIPRAALARAIADTSQYSIRCQGFLFNL